MRLVLFCISVLLLNSCAKKSQDIPQGPQPFLIICAFHQNETLCGTIGSDVDFTYDTHKPDGSDSIYMNAHLLNKNLEGFRISWEVKQTMDGKQVVNFTSQESIPWGTLQTLKSIPGYTVKAYYSPIPANEINH